jgi:hypothetical protein
VLPAPDIRDHRCWRRLVAEEQLTSPLLPGLAIVVADLFA